jgi:hypothetical protein
MNDRRRPVITAPGTTLFDLDSVLDTLLNESLGNRDDCGVDSRYGSEG